MAIRAYANDTPEKRHKAVSAGKAIDNGINLSYTPGGASRTHFNMEQWLKYFSPEKLGDRIKLIYK